MKDALLSQKWYESRKLSEQVTLDHVNQWLSANANTVADFLFCYMVSPKDGENMHDFCVWYSGNAMVTNTGVVNVNLVRDWLIQNSQDVYLAISD